MKLKFLAKLSHLITMLFGVALGMTISILYQHNIAIFVTDLWPVIIGIIFLSSILRIYTLVLWNCNDYKTKFFNENLPE